MKDIFKDYKEVCVATAKFYWEYNNGLRLVKDKNQARYLGDSVIKKHLAGTTTIGLSPFVNNKNVLYGGIDFDVHGLTPKDKENKIKEMGKEKFKEYENKVLDKARKEIKTDIPKIKNELKKLNILHFFNSSGSEGVHLRVYSNKPLNAKIMRYFLMDIQERVLGEVRHEVFPKQDDLTEERPFGNQMKAVLAIHPRTKKLAGIIEDDKILNRINSLKFISKFVKKIPNAKEIKFDIPLELEQKYKKVKLSEAQLKKINKQGIPYYCGGIEEVGAEQFLPSGKATKHDYLDGGVYQYCSNNNKPQILERYKEIQGRDNTAFNNSEKWKWSCGVIHKYLRENESEGIEKWKSLCQKCPHFKDFFIPDLEPLLKCGDDLEKRNRIIKDILKQKKFADPLDLEVLIDQISFVTGVKPQKLKQQWQHEKNKQSYEYEPNEKKDLKLNENEISFLEDPLLLQRINKEFDKKIVGEETNRLAIFLNGCGKFVKNASIASYNLCINSSSGAGKDYSTKGVLKIFPKDDVVIRSRISPTVFTYWHNSKFEPNWSWDNKISLLSDISNMILNHEVFKLMCSDGTHSTIVINQQAVDIEIKGKPVMFITTASASPNNEMLRRFPMLELDESINQTKAIKKRQAEAAAIGKTLDYDKNLINALKKLKRVNVKIPFGEKLVDCFPEDHIIMRTHFQRLLDYIKASAALYQYQRKTDQEGFVLATGEDYDNAIIPLKATTSNPFMIPLSKKQKTLLGECEKLGDFSAKEMEPHIPFLVLSKLYEALAKLQELGFLNSYIKDSDQSKRPIRRYKYIDFKIDNIPSWNDIICRKKGIKETGGRERNKGNKGMIPLLKNNSLNSPGILCQKKNFLEESIKITEEKISQSPCLKPIK